LTEIAATKAMPSLYDGFAKAHEDEPIFTLLGRDPLAEPLVMDWADRARRAARLIEDDKERVAELHKAREAEEVAFAMRAYRLKEPESLDAARASYNGTAKAEGWREQLAIGVQKLRNAASAIAEAQEIFDALELLDNDDHVMLDQAKSIAAQIAKQRSPRRASWAQKPTLAQVKEELDRAGARGDHMKEGIT